MANKNATTVKYKRQVTHEIRLKLMKEFSLTSKDLRKLVIKFTDHRHRAKRRKIKFLLTLGEWLRIWTDSGHLHERGCRKGQYCMARIGDKGPYSIGNVKIITHSDNLSEGLKGNKNSLGCFPSMETRRKISLAGIGNKRAVGSRGNYHKRSKRTIDLMREAGKRRRPPSIATRVKISNSIKEWWKTRHQSE